MATKTKIVNMRTSESDYDEIKKFAAFRGMSVQDLVYESVMERIEDWEDIQSAAEYMRQKEEGSVQTVTWEQAQKELGLL